MLYDSTAIATMQTKASNSFLDTLVFGIPQFSRLGEISNVKLIFYWQMDGAAPSTAHGIAALGGALSWTWSDTNAYVVNEFDFTPSISTANKDSWNLESQVTVTLNDNTSDVGQSLLIQEAAIEVEYKLEQGYGKVVETIEYIQKPYEVMISPRNAFDERGDVTYETRLQTHRIVTHQDKSAPKEVDLLYINAKGRKFGSWIDANSRDNGYNQNDLIENPIYIIEDILRSEVGLSTSDIDFETFDSIGNTTNGSLGTAFIDSVADIKFALSQFKFIDAISLIQKICKQSGLYFFFNSEGKATLRQRLQTSQYSSADRTIDFNDCLFKGFSRTNINSIRNEVEINYRYDYGTEQTLLSDTSSDATSKAKYSASSKAQKLKLDADCIQDTTTAQKLGDCYLNWFKDRKNRIELTVLKPKYSDLEIGDIVNFTNFPSDLKAYGNAITTSDYFIINDISKTPNSTDIKCTEVS
tara:strand:+ start:7884 stop:9290 length:1407 start_codon:yes stop_codon:yes gene_type:complete